MKEQTESDSSNDVAQVWGSGFVAFTCHGAVLTLQATPEDPVYTDPQATVAWTHDPQFKVRTTNLHNQTSANSCSCMKER